MKRKVTNNWRNPVSIIACVFIAGLCFPGRSSAQLVNCNIFLKGKYLEVGINNNGAYGTSEAAPGGYHANVTDTMFNFCTSLLEPIVGLGFVVDVQMNGWTTGTPAYYGDMVMPDNPREGWAVEDSSGNGTAYSFNSCIIGPSSSGFTGSLMGGNVSYTTVASTKVGLWAGSLASDSLEINQATVIDTASLFFMVHVTFHNAGAATDTFYYLRTINPHTDYKQSGLLGNMNKIEHQLPDPSNLTVVSATGTVYPDAYVALATKDLRARGFIMQDSTLPGPGTFASIYAGDSVHYQYADSLSANVAIGLVFRIPLGPGDSTSIDFGYGFKPGLIDSIITDTTIIPLQVAAPGIAKIRAFPNPAGDYINVTGLATGDQLALFDLTGRQVINWAPNATGMLRLEGIPAGSYMLLARDQHGDVKARIPVVIE